MPGKIKGASAVQQTKLALSCKLCHIMLIGYLKEWFSFSGQLYWLESRFLACGRVMIFAHWNFRCGTKVSLTVTIQQLRESKLRHITCLKKSEDNALSIAEMLVSQFCIRSLKMMHCVVSCTLCQVLLSQTLTMMSHVLKCAANVQCQAQPSHDRSLILDKASSLYNVIYLPQQDGVLNKAGFHLRHGGSRLADTDERPSLLKAKEDCYDGVIIDPCSLPANTGDFVDRLKSSLRHWKIQRKRGVWLQLPSDLADFVPIAIKEGFKFHHAEPSYVMMTYWIPDSPSTLPPNASHQVGIGAFVMNYKKEVLAVQEKNGPLRGSGVWKMPTGLINQGEDLCCGAVREVKEETGVETEFVQVVSFRHGHHVSFSKSDLYFTCALRPLSCQIVLQDEEIEAAKWMPLEEFQSQVFFSENNARRKMLDLCVDSLNGIYTGFKAKKLHSSSLAQPTQYFFHE